MAVSLFGSEAVTGLWWLLYVTAIPRRIQVPVRVEAMGAVTEIRIKCPRGELE
jgi:hypothetical protein